MVSSFQLEGAGDDLAPGARGRGAAGLRVMGRDLGLGLGGEERRADLVEAGFPLKELAGHLRLAREAAEIDDGAGLPEDLRPDRGGIGRRTAWRRDLGGWLRG